LVEMDICRMKNSLLRDKNRSSDTYENIAARCLDFTASRPVDATSECKFVLKGLTKNSGRAIPTAVKAR